MPTRISESTFDNIMNQIAKTDVDTAFTHNHDCTVINNLHMGPNCNMDNVDIELGNTVCPLQYIGPNPTDPSVAKHTITEANKKLADHASRRVAHTSGFPLFGGTTITSNVADASLNASISIKDKIFDDCSSSINLINSYECVISKIKNVCIKQGQQGSTVSDCVNKATDHSDIYQSLISNIAQSEVNKTESSLYIWEGLVFFISSVLIIIALLGGDLPWKMRFAIIIVIILLTIFVLYWVIKTYNKKHIVQWCPDCTILTDKNSCDGAMCYWDADANPARCRCDTTQTDCRVQCPIFLSKSDCTKNYCGWDDKQGVCTGSKDFCKDPQRSVK
jgi:hypothetical protein